MKKMLWGTAFFLLIPASAYVEEGQVFCSSLWAADYPLVYPFPPQNVTARAMTDRGVQVKWSNDPRNGQSVAKWRVFRDFAPIGEVAGGALEFTDTTATGSKTVQYNVRAVTAGGRESPLTGIYAIVPFSASLDRLLEYPFVSGLCLQVKWPEVEPEMGHRDFSSLDKILDAAARHHKRVGLFFRKYLAGLPRGLTENVRWLAAADAVRREGAGVSQTPLEPYPLDPALEVAWTDFLRAFAHRYDGHPAVHYVLLLGPGEHHMALPISRVMGAEGDAQRKRQFAALEELGFTMEKYLDAWRKTVDLYAEIFPNTPWAYDITTQTGLGSVNVQRPAEYGIRKYGTQIFLFTENLNGFDWWLGALPGLPETTTFGVWGNNRSGILRLAEHTILGWQMFIRSWGVRPFDAQQYVGQDKGRAGPMKKALENGLTTGAYWLEVWQSDCHREPYQPLLIDAANRLGHVRVEVPHP